MRRAVAIFAGMLAAMLAAHGSAFAFEQSPEPPPPPPVTTPAPDAKQPPVVALQTPGTVTTAPAKSSVSMFHLGLFPKLNFGLELMYGDQKQSDVQQPGPSFDDNSDVTVLGNVKRRF